jgi:hypothetical protein
VKYFLIIILVFLIGCNLASKPSSKEIASLYVDLLIAEEEYKTDSDSLIIVTDSLYQLYKISEDVYMSELESFKYNEETWTEFFKLAEDYLDSLKVRENRNTKSKIE